jgi:type 1 glutamine amidotransferase
MNTLKNSFLIILAVLLSISVVPQAAIAQQDTDPLEILMITGGGPWHDYNTQKDQIKNGLEERLSNINLTIDYEGGDTNTMESTDFKFSRHLKEDWAADFDVVIYNHCNLQVKDENYVKNIVSEHVDKKVPAVMIHCPIHLYQYAEGDAPQVWWDFTGAVSYFHEKENHPNTPPYTIETLEPQHPIMKYNPRSWRTPSGELYMIVELSKNANPLSHAYSVETQSYSETAWTNHYEGVRVFTSSLGHHNEAMGSDVNLNLIASGVLWAAGKLQDDGTPSQGYEGDRGLGWISLLDEEGTLNGWIESGGVMDWTSPSWYSGKTVWPTVDSTSNGESFSREGDTLVVEGDKRNLYYDGRIEGGYFKNFEFKADVYTYPESASGIYFHTRYEEDGDPVVGYEAQINASKDGMSRTGSLAEASEINNTPHSDKEWFTYHIKFNDNSTTIMVNGKVVNEYEVPENSNMETIVNMGTIGIQSEGEGRVYIRNPMIRLLPDL